MIVIWLMGKHSLLYLTVVAMPIFGEIKDIIITPVFIHSNTMYFNKHFHSYEVIACTNDSTLIYHQHLKFNI